MKFDARGGVSLRTIVLRPMAGISYSTVGRGLRFTTMECYVELRLASSIGSNKADRALQWSEVLDIGYRNGPPRRY